MIDFLAKHPLILAEASIAGRLAHVDGVDLHPSLFNAPLIYDDHAAAAMEAIYCEYLDTASQFNLPILLAAPTWRLDRDRITKAGYQPSLVHDSVAYIRRIEAHHAVTDSRVGGLLGPANDCYSPNDSLSAADAEVFHQWQADELATAGVDYLLAQTMPALSEAEGIARAMLATGRPSIVSFCINREGNVLDGTPLADAISSLDTRLDGQLLGYMVNCSHPSFLSVDAFDETTIARLIGFDANGSSKDHSDLDDAPQLMSDPIDQWASAMIDLNDSFGVKILGGCCGTDNRHLQALCNLNGQKLPPENE